MHFDERTIGDYKIYTGAMETPDGFIAGLAVSRLRGPAGEPEQLFFDDALDNGRTFECPGEALSYAMARGWFELQARSVSHGATTPTTIASL
jgi:hypothetical protein